MHRKMVSPFPSRFCYLHSVNNSYKWNGPFMIKRFCIVKNKELGTKKGKNMKKKQEAFV